MAISVEKVRVAGNRGPCGGVNMALEAAHYVLEIVNGREPVYTNWDIVNNTLIMKELGSKGLVNVRNNFDLVPDDSILFFSAHGVSPAFHEVAKQKNLLVIDVTCQLVTRVHNLVKDAVTEGRHAIYIGADGHPETIGVMGEVNPNNITLVERVEDVEKLELAAGGKVVYSQTTLLPDEVVGIEQAILAKYPVTEIPSRLDVCYAMGNRQAAVEKLLNDGVDLLLVVGSKHSHNSQGLKKRGLIVDVPSYLVDESAEIEEGWFTPSIRKVGLTSGASVLDRLLVPVIDWFRLQSTDIEIAYLPQVIDEKVRTFRLPQKDIEALKKRYAT